MRTEGECGEQFASIADYREHLWRCPLDTGFQARMDHRMRLLIRGLFLVAVVVVGIEFVARPTPLLGFLLASESACLILLGFGP